MPPDGDPYLYPGTTTLKNKLGIRDPKALERAEDERAAAPYALLERNLPQPPFTFETLKDIHRLFGSVYEWAGQPRTIGPAARTTKSGRHGGLGSAAAAP
jgi:cell filamentation protein